MSIKQPRADALTAFVLLCLLAQHASAQHLFATSSSTSSSSSSISSPPASSSSPHSFFARSSTGRFAATEPSLSVPVWALAILVVGALFVFVATLKLASVFYWASEKQRVEREDDGAADRRRGGVAPISSQATLSSSSSTSNLHSTPVLANVVRMEQPRRAVPEHISITQQTHAADEVDGTSEVSRWDSRDSDELYAQATPDARVPVEANNGAELVIVISGEQE